MVQDESVETGLSQRVVVQITSNLDRTGDTRVLVRKDSPDGQAMGILSDSVIVADHLATVLPREIDKVIGRCTCMPEVETALRRVSDSDFSLSPQHLCYFSQPIFVPS